MKKLDLADSRDKNQFYKHVLAFWLGSNTTLLRLKSSIVFELYGNNDNFIYRIYFILIIFDKHISFLKRKKSSSYTVLTDCRLALLHFFNVNFEMFISDRKRLVLSFTVLLNKHFDEKLITNYNDYYFLQKTKVKIMYALHNTNGFSQAIGPIQDNELDDIRTKITTNVIEQITNAKSHFFYRDLSYSDNNYLVNKFLIETNDSIIIDVLHIKKEKRHLN